MIGFVKIEDCPLCGRHGKTLYHEQFTSPHLWGFIESSYVDVPREPFIGEEFIVKRCPKCDFRWQGNILNPEGMDAFYGSWIPKESLNKRRCGDSETYAGYAREAGLISRLVGKKNHDIDVLDFGMGWGYWCLMAKAFGYKVTGCELSDERRAHAKEELAISSVKSLAESGKRFDFINTEQTLEHIPHPKEVLTSLVESLKEKGIIYVSVPDGRKLKSNDFSKANFEKAPWRSLKPLEHINCFTHDSLISLAKGLGLKPISQPFKLSHRHGPSSVARGVMKRFYLQYLGTSLYFKKT